MDHRYQRACNVVCLKVGPIEICTTRTSFHLLLPPANKVWDKVIFSEFTGRGQYLYDVTCGLAAWSDVPSGGCFCPWFHVPSGGLCLGEEGLPGGLCPGDLCPGRESLSRGVSVQGVSVWGCLCLGRSLSRGLCPGESLSMGLCRETLDRDPPPPNYVDDRTVRITLECCLVLKYAYHICFPVF